MQNTKNFYELLGITPSASIEDIRQAFHLAARRYHPDVNLKPNASDRFIQIKEAFEILSNPAKRADYDRSILMNSQDEFINYTVLYSRSHIPAIPENQLIYALLDIYPGKATIDEAPKSPPLNIVIILDNSTSMKGTRLQAIKNSAIEIVQKLKPHDILSIVTFNDTSRVIIPAGKADDIRKLESEILRIQTHGGTEIYMGMLSGFNEARKYLSSKYHNHMILITDGRTYGDEEACLDLADQCASLGITISCLGIGTEWNDEFLDDMAKRTGGTSKYISSSKELSEFLIDMFDGLEQTIATRIEFSFNLAKRVELVYAFRLKPDLGVLPTSSPIQLGSCPKDSLQRILFEFQLPPIPSGTNKKKILDGFLKYDMPNTSEFNKRIPVSLSCDVSNTIISDSTPPPLIVESMSKLTLYRMQEQAKKLVEDGDIESAKEKLQYVATHLFSKGEHDLAKTVVMEVDNLEKQNIVSEAGKKVIKYGTRALLLSAGKISEGNHD